MVILSYSVHALRNYVFVANFHSGSNLLGVNTVHILSWHLSVQTYKDIIYGLFISFILLGNKCLCILCVFNQI